MARVDYTGIKTTQGTRMMHLGLVSLLARKGIRTKVGSQGPEGRPIPYIFKGIRRGKQAQSFRLQPRSLAFDGEEPDYMQLRNFSKSAWEEDAPGASYQRKKLQDGREKIYKRNETDGQAKARRLWMGPSGQPGERMRNYEIEGVMAGAEQMMERVKMRFNEAGMQTVMQTLTQRMMESLVQVISSAGTWRDTVGKKNYEGAGGNLRELKMGKWKRQGMPIIGSDSLEESQLYVLNASTQKMIEAALAGKEFDVNTGIRLAGSLETKVKNPKNTMLDIQKEAHKNIYNKIIQYIKEEDLKETIHFGDTRNRKYLERINNIAGFDVGEQPLEVRFKHQWDQYRSVENLRAIKNYEELKGFITYLNQEAAKYKVSKAPRGKDTELDKGNVGQFSRRLQETRRSYIFTQPLSAGGRMIMFVIKQNDIPTFIPMYIEGTNDDLGTTISRRLLGTAAADRLKSQLEDFSGHSYAVFDKTGLKMTHSVAGSFLHETQGRMGELSTTVTMGTPPALNKWLRQWVGEAAETWFHSTSWDSMFDPNSMKGQKFARWFNLWIAKSREAETQLDNANRKSGWRAWIERSVMPDYVREGGVPPSGRRRSGRMMPYDAQPRTWHSPLYVRPYFVQDKLGLRGQVAKNVGTYRDYKQTEAYYKSGWRGIRL
jgi:hypothetical protein